MAPNTDATTDDSNIEHPAADLETIVVGPDDIVEAMRRNKRDETEQRSHVLRVSPALEGEQRATLHVSEANTHYPPELDPKPIHIGPAAFLVGHDAGSRHPDYRNEWSYPDHTAELGLFRDEFDTYDDHGDTRPLTEEEKDEWNEWWSTAIEMWEDRVRHALKQTDELTLTSQHPDVEETTVAVRFETDDE
jgi:hypothetical protein